MDDSLIQRYQAGGDIYASLQTQYGTSAADAVAAAAQTGDETQINAALVNAKYGQPLNTSTASILANQLETDPLAAPLASANNVLGNTLLSFLKNPLVVIAVAGGLFFFFGGGELIRASLKGKAKNEY
jgi:hypothetical protein